MEQLIDSKNRLGKSALNVVTGVALQVLTLLLSFIVRVVFVQSIGYSYLGISSLFANILTILSVADLGFGTSISISLYAALKKADQKNIAGIISYYKKIYLIIGGIIFAIGCGVCPFVGYLVNTPEPIPFLQLYFFIYLINLVSTYFISYRHAIIKADQKNGVLNIIQSLILLAKSIIELLVILILPKFFEPYVAYIVYLAVMVLATYAIEIWSSIVAKKMYPYAFQKATISKEEKTEISKNVKSLLLYKVCNAVNKSVDSILISILVSTAILGKYSNYTLIIGTLMGFGCIISRNSIASLGNFVLTESKEKQVGLFNVINFIHIAMAAFFIVNYVGILEPFFKFAFGLDSTLSLLTLIFTAIHLGFNVNYQVNELFRETTKMFRKIPFISAINLGLNIVLSIVLGIFFGLEGIIAGTLIAYFLTSFWFETFALFKYHFKTSSKHVWFELGFAILSIAAFSTGAYFITSKIIVGDALEQLIFSVIVSVVLSIGCLCSFMWFKEFKHVFDIGKRIIISVYQKINEFLSRDKIQDIVLYVSIIALPVLIMLRDIVGLEINKYFYAALILLSALLLKKENFLGYFLFIIPFHSGLPTGTVYPAMAILFVVKNLKMFKNWRLIINYTLIPLTIAILEGVLSTIYGATPSTSLLLTLFAVLLIFAFVIYDRKTTSTKPLKMFIFGACFACFIILMNWAKISLYMSTNGNEPSMTFMKMMLQRFGDVDKFIEWTEYWCKIDYPLRTSMFLSDNPNYLGLLALSSVCILAVLLFRRESLFDKIIYGVAITFMLFIGIYTGSKSFFICLVLFIVYYSTMLYADYKIKLWQLLAFLGTFAIAALCVCLFVPFVRENIVNRLGDDSGRISLIVSYFTYIFSQPLIAIFGCGATRLQALSGISEPPHNAIVQIVGGYGFVGFAILVGALVLTIIKGRPKTRFFKDNALCSLCPLIAFFIFSMTSQIFVPINTLIYGLPSFAVVVMETNHIDIHGPMFVESRASVKKEKAPKVKKEKIVVQKPKAISPKGERKGVLVVGAAGFIGANLCKQLLKTTNYLIVGLDNLNNDYDVSLKKARLADIKPFKNFNFVKGDVSDRELIDSLFKRYRFDYIVNLIAQNNDQNSDAIIKSNIIGSYYLLEACKTHSIKHYVYASSITKKDEQGNVVQPVSLLDTTKMGDDLLVNSYSQQHNIPTTGLRFSNVYGGGDKPTTKFFELVNKLVSKESIELEDQKVSLLFIDDVAELVAKIVDNPLKEKGTRIYDVANSKQTKISDLIKAIYEQLIKSGLLPTDYALDDHVSVSKQKNKNAFNVDVKPLKDDFAFEPKTTLEEGIKTYIEWFKEYQQTKK